MAMALLPHAAEPRGQKAESQIFFGACELPMLSCCLNQCVNVSSGGVGFSPAGTPRFALFFSAPGLLKPRGWLPSRSLLFKKYDKAVSLGKCNDVTTRHLLKRCVEWQQLLGELLLVGLEGCHLSGAAHLVVEMGWRKGFSLWLPSPSPAWGQLNQTVTTDCHRSRMGLWRETPLRVISESPKNQGCWCRLPEPEPPVLL